jgi:polysaccharide export outer membrane protein
MLFSPRALLTPALILGLTSSFSFGQQATPGTADGVPVKPAAAVDGSYQLSTSEVVKVTVFQEEDLNATARIAEDGTVQLPLVGAVKIGGKTVRQAALAIEAALRNGFLVQPQVSVTVAEFAKRRFAILGEVSRPGTYEIPANEVLDVIQAIGLAGGYTRSANTSKIIVKRVTQGSEQVFRLNGTDLARSGREKAFRVMPGDTITVAESFF